MNKISAEPCDWLSILNTTNVVYPSDGTGNTTTTESESLLANAQSVAVTNVTIPDPSAGTLGWLIQCNIGGSWTTVVQSFIPAFNIAEWDFGSEGILLPGPVRFQQASADFITTFSFRRIS